MCDDHQYMQDQIVERWQDYFEALRARKLGRYSVDLSCDDEVCFHLIDDCPDLDEYGYPKQQDDGVTYWSDADAAAEEMLNRTA